MTEFKRGDKVRIKVNWQPPTVGGVIRAARYNYPCLTCGAAILPKEFHAIWGAWHFCLSCVEAL